MIFLVSIQDVDAIATTVKPGLIMSLDIGMKYTKTLIEESQYVRLASFIIRICLSSM